MILFRNVDIETAVPGIKIEDVRISPIQLSPTVRQRPILPGADFVRMAQGTRTVEITFGLPEQDMRSRREMLDAVTGWAMSATPQPMAFPFLYTGRLLDVICTSLPEPSARQWWESRLSMVFTAFEPFFYSATEYSEACGTAFTVGGDVPPLMRIERTLPDAASDQSYSDGMNTMTFSTVPAGDLVIDLNRQTAAVGGASIMEYWPLTGASFIIPKTGAMIITGTGTVKWRERWQG
jgi:hypothetical protein